MKRLSLFTTIVAILISSSSFSYATSNSTGGTISFSGYVYEPQCEINLTNKSQINVQCFRNGKNISTTGSLKDGKKIESDYVKVEYDRTRKLPMLNVIYE
ncbi:MULTISPECIES: hypothetical protein [unclassified Providencia]|uniref:hypothetical protein n=1 Tax=unclassified Providencia TaxID=2633465 RepID=UPI000E84FAB3|nr:hypothetical protein [Providencia sp.]MBP6080899.1 type 1 fimbrial protein [Providencia sp.]HBO24181.1 hypothetical protein [Providencia sp.]